MLSAIERKYRNSVDSIFDALKSYFVNEFQEILYDTPQSEHVQIEKKLASVPGLLIELFSQISE